MCWGGLIPQALPAADQKAINEAIGDPDESAAVSKLEKILDKQALAIVDINAESRVKVEQGPVKRLLRHSVNLVVITHCLLRHGGL